MVLGYFFSFAKKECMKLDILAFAAHPDDTELACSGTIAKHLAMGKKVGVLDFTRGELGTRGSAEIRDIEAQNSAQVLGLTVRENIALSDGFFEDNRESQLKIIQKIRKFQPEIVLANALEDRHIDHPRAGRLAINACFLSGLRKINTQDGQGNLQKEWRPKAVYHYVQDRFIKPSFVVDITDFWEKKMESIKAFKTQFYDPESDEPQTPISSEDFLNFLEARAREMGRIIGVKYGEGFVSQTALKANSLFDIF